MFRRLLLLAFGLAIAAPVGAQTIVCSGINVPITLSVPQACQGFPVNLRVTACGPCVQLFGFTNPPQGPIRITAAANVGQCITTECAPESLLIPMGTFAQGHYAINVELFVDVTLPDSTHCTSTRRETVVFDVPTNCGGVPPPPPPPYPLPFVQAIEFGPPACSGQPIPFRIAGFLPNTCYQFHGVQFLPDPRMDPLPHPPVARVLIGVDDCRGVPCIEQGQVWEARQLLPPLPAGFNSMIVEVEQVSICDTARTPLSLISAVIPFFVADTCGDSIPPPYHCMLANWVVDHDDRECNARVGPGTPAVLRFAVGADVSVGGLQGNIVLDPPALTITDIRAIGAASGMQVAWQRTASGAKYVLFSDHGQVIPPCPPGGGVFCDATVLEVVATQTTRVVVPPVTLAHMNDLLVADSIGNAIPFCPTLVRVTNVARICSGGETCDANSDGSLDVRDLVVMARCVREPNTCPASTERYDCNRDSLVGVDDVVCCAFRILSGRVPDSLAVIRLPELGVAFQAPVVTAAGVDLPLRVRGADRLGAASFAFRVPAGVTLMGVDLPGASSSWMHVEDASGTRVRIGLIALTPSTPAELNVVVHLGTFGGGAAGAVELTAADFADVDGRAVTPSEGVIGIAVGGTPRITLSAARPNPMSRETRFELRLTAAASVDLAIFDLTGRRVATLAKGRMDAGGHSILWDGTRTDGSRAPDGVYFYRASGAGDPVTRRLVLMRGN